MAKLRLEDFQKQLDALVIETERLKNAQVQAQAVYDAFEERLRHGTATVEEVQRANQKLTNATYKLTEHEDALAAKQKEILDAASAANFDRDKLNPNRQYSTIMQEQSGGGGDQGAIASFFSKKGGGNVAAGVINAFTGLINVASDIIVAEKKRRISSWLQEQDIYINTIETTSRIFQRNMKTFAKGMQGALSSSFASITEGVQEGAYSAAQSSVDVGTELISNTMEKRLDELKQQQYAILRAKQGELERWNLRASEINAVANGVSGIVNAVPVFGSAVGSLVNSIVGAGVKIATATKEIDIMKTEKLQEMAEKQLEIITKVQQEALEAAGNAVKEVLNFSKSIENLSLKTDAAARSMANMIGMSSGNIDRYEKFIFNAARNLSFTNSSGKTTYLDKTAEDLGKMQEAYIDSSARNITMSRKDFIKTALLGKELGDDNLASALLGDMDYFNQTIENSTDMIHRMFTEANKAGVSNRKFAKDLQQNLKLAQKYTFKGGVEALMKMSVWAQKTRFNMQGLETAVDKILDGGIEGVIKQSAQLQVLGGNMAMYSDPFGMMYDAMADPEALGKRYNKMLEGMGTFNKKTGQVEINGPDVLRLKAYAQATGISYQDARNQVTQMGKNAQIDSYLKKTGADKRYTEEQKALIYNKAQYNTKTGQWQVTLDNGETFTDINNLDKDQIKELMPVEERIEDKVTKIMNYTERMAGVTNHGQAMVSDETWSDLRSNLDKRMNENLRFFNQDLPILKDEVIKANKFVTEQNEIQHGLIMATNNILEQQFKIIKSSSEQMIKNLSEGDSAMRKALNAVSATLEEGQPRLAQALDELCKVLNIEQDRPRQEEIEENKKNARAAAHETRAKELESKGQHVASKIESATAEEIKGNHGAARGLEKSAFGHFTRDGVFSANGSPMFVEASNVTPINDGAITSDGDFMLAAEDSGPFDTLFKKIFRRINDVFNIVSKIDFGTMLQHQNRSSGVFYKNASKVYDGGDYSSVEKAINSSITDANRITEQITSFGDTINKATQNTTNNSLSNVVKMLEAITSSDSSRYDNIENGLIENNIVATNRPNSSTNKSSVGGNYTYTDNSYRSTSTNEHTNNNADGVEFTIPERMRMMAYAKLNGMDYGDVMDFTANNMRNGNGMVMPGETRKQTNSVERYESREIGIGDNILQQESFIDRLAMAIKESGISGGSYDKPLEIKFTGSIDLKSGSQTVDILGMMKNDPNFIRSFAEMLAYQFSRNSNGGKSYMFPNRYAITS